MLNLKPCRARLLMFCAALCWSTSASAQPFQTSSTGDGSSFSNEQPTLGLTYLVSAQGVFPSRNLGDIDGDDLSLETSLASIRMFAGNFAPGGTLLANGQNLPIVSNQALFSLVGTIYGGDGRTNFDLPDLTNRVSVSTGNGPGLQGWNIGQTRGSSAQTLSVSNLPSHSHSFGNPNSPTTSSGNGQSFSNLQPTLATTYAIALQGIFPSRSLEAPIDGDDASLSSEPFLGQVAQFAGNFAPRGWAKAEGQLLPISQNPALFSILGTTYGGDGRTTFALPDLRGRTPVHPGTATDQAVGTSPTWQLGQKLGSDNTALSINQMPEHTHTMPDLSTVDETDPAGGNVPINNVQPGLGLNYIISLIGTFPSAGSNSSGISEPLLGEIALFAGTFAPRGWAFAEGQLLSIAQNPSLFSLLGTTYGGDGINNFALPDMRGRTGVHAEGAELGVNNGQNNTLLTVDNLPAHTHDYVPEPTSLTLLALGGLALVRRRRS